MDGLDVWRHAGVSDKVGLVAERISHVIARYTIWVAVYDCGDIVLVSCWVLHHAVEPWSREEYSDNRRDSVCVGVV